MFVYKVLLLTLVTRCVSWTPGFYHQSEINRRFPYEREDEIRERIAHRDYYRDVLDLQREWDDPHASKPISNLTHHEYRYIHEIENLRLEEIGAEQPHDRHGRYRRSLSSVNGTAEGRHKRVKRDGRRSRRRLRNIAGRLLAHRRFRRRHHAGKGGIRRLGRLLRRKFAHRGFHRVSDLRFHGQIRRECRLLSRKDRQRYFTAIRELKSRGHYDVIASRHHKEESPAAHNGPAFLPWHRMYILQFEVALQTVDPGVTLCYWDSSLDGRLGAQYKDTALFDYHMFGQWTGGPVRDGPFAHFKAVPGCEKIGATLTRKVAKENALYTSRDFKRFDRFRRYKDIAGTKRFEKDHGFIHVAVGGHMKNLNCSPVDPIFFHHHAFVDYLFDRFRQNQRRNKKTDYIRKPPKHHGFHDKMLPFKNIKNGDGLRETPIRYEESPSMLACRRNHDCRSDMLWCDKGRCTARIRQGARCFKNRKHSCYCHRGVPACKRGFCACH